MAECFITRRGGAGVGLNFKIVGGTQRPETPKENMIWVKTNSKISEWIFSFAEPLARVENSVWIKLGVPRNDKSFNALKKNGIILTPIQAFQVQNGAYAKKSAEIYTNGAWKEFEYILLGYGEDKLGQISFRAAGAQTAWQKTDFVENEDQTYTMNLKCSASGWSNLSVSFANAISKETSTKIIIDYEVLNNAIEGPVAKVHLRTYRTFDDALNGKNSLNSVTLMEKGTQTGATKATVDLGDTPDSFYLAFYFNASANDEISMKIKSITMK